MNVLVVDDTAMYRDSFCSLLKSCYPYLKITTAESGSEALVLTQEQNFDLIILDYHLTSITGGDVIRHLRRRAMVHGTTLPPLVLMSSQPDAAVFARMLGTAAFLSKPVSAEELDAAIGALLAPAAPKAKGTGPLLWRVHARRA